MLNVRYRRILLFFGRVILSIIWWDVILPKIGLRKLSENTRQKRLKQIAQRFHSLAVQMGGVMIKVGQFLSSRLDVLPREITTELAGLQDEVRPESFADIRRVIEGEFDAPLEELFTHFETEPLASASIGQVHRAHLRATQDSAENDVAVKVQRPNIEAIVAVDLDALRIVSSWIHLYPPVRQRINVPALMEEFSRSLNEEIDYLQEGRNAETFTANFSNQDDVRVPCVFWSRTTRRVLTLEYIQAIKITDYSALEAAGLKRSDVAKRLFDTYLQQIFEDRFFHADPHPGNLFVLPTNTDEGKWQIIFVDFGMTGELNEKMLNGLREVLISVGTQDASRLVRAYQKLEILLPGADTDAIQNASAVAFSRFWGRTAPELSSLGREEVMQFAHEFSDVLYDLPFQIPENFILLGRCIGILSGLCSGLDPEFNIWQQIVPYAGRLINDQHSSGLGWIVQEIGDTLRIAASLPRRSEGLMNRLEQGKISFQIPDVQRQLIRLEKTLHHLTAAIVFAVLVMCAVQLHLADQRELTIAFGVGAAVALFMLIFAR
jgi:predicted unusual protein kinase regulating ubiquinone biosynthesis (AarF/ABC1/UbiB family)